MNVIATPTSSNRKTGNVPTLWVGKTEEEAKESCSGCGLISKCYAWSGAVRFGAISARKKAASAPETRTIDAAIRGAARSARMLRATGIGDIGRSGQSLADYVTGAARSAGLALVGYTHHWREADVAASWRGRLMASTETPEDADRAVAEGWRATLVVPADTPRVSTTPAGHKVIVCPAQLAEEPTYHGKPIVCNDCKLCEAAKPGPVVAFRFHGNAAR